VNEFTLYKMILGRLKIAKYGLMSQEVPAGLFHTCQRLDRSVWVRHSGQSTSSYIIEIVL